MRSGLHWMLVPALAGLGCAKGASTSSSTPTPAAAEASATASYALDAAPPALAAALPKADAAIAALQQTLTPRLLGELERSGPTGALQVCAAEAQGLTARIGAEKGVALGRTSFRLRNPANVPRPWAREYVLAHAGKKAAEVEPRVFALGTSAGVLRPIPVGGACMSCHGPKAQLTPEVARALAAAYPEDQATGFLEGELRGFFWVEVPLAQ